MYKLSTYLVVTYFSYLPTYLFMSPISYRSGYQGETKILTQLRFHPQLSNNMHPVDGALVGAGSLLPCRPAQVVGIHGYLARLLWVGWDSATPTFNNLLSPQGHVSCHLFTKWSQVNPTRVFPGGTSLNTGPIQCATKLQKK
jgi:hypothetical protein